MIKGRKRIKQRPLIAAGKNDKKAWFWYAALLNAKGGTRIDADWQIRFFRVIRDFLFGPPFLDINTGRD